jgi:drug/metabolite transporter (DMT)-like permease
MIKAQNHLYHLLIIFAVASWGLNVIATKILVTTFSPITITAFRILTAGISVFIVLFFFKKIRIPTGKEFVYILFGGFFNVVGHHYFLSLGLTETSAANGGLILGLGPILTAILAFFFLGSKVTLFRIIGIIIAFTGVSFIVKTSGSVSGVSIGDVFVFLSILSQAISFIIIKKSSTTLDPRLMTGYMLVIGSFILFIISLIKEPDGLETLSNGSFGVWGIFLASAIIATALGHMIYNYAIEKVGVTEAAIFLNLTPFFSLVGAALFIGENIALVHIIGFVLIVIGVSLGSGTIEVWIITTNQKRKMYYLKKRET